jgi:hypothetical protein
MAQQPLVMGISEYGKFESTSLFAETEGKEGVAYAKQIFHNLGNMFQTKLIRCEYLIFTKFEWIESDSDYEILEKEVRNLTKMISNPGLNINADHLNESEFKIKEMKSVCELLKNNIKIKNVDRLSVELDELSDAVSYRLLGQCVKDLATSIPQLDIRKANLSEIDYNINKIQKICESLKNSEKFKNIQNLSKELDEFEKKIYDLALEKHLKHEEIAKERDNNIRGQA